MGPEEHIRLSRDSVTPDPQGMGEAKGIPQGHAEEKRLLPPPSEQLCETHISKGPPHLLHSYLCLLFFEDNLQDTNMCTECQVSHLWKLGSETMCLGPALACLLVQYAVNT